MAAGDDGHDEREYIGGEGVDEVDEEREREDDDEEEEEDDDDELGDNALVFAEETVSSATGDSDATAPSSAGDIGQVVSVLLDAFFILVPSRCPFVA